MQVSEVIREDKGDVVMQKVANVLWKHNSVFLFEIWDIGF